MASFEKTRKTPKAEMNLTLKRKNECHNAKETASQCSEETFDDFLASQEMLEACEDHALKEVIVEQLATALQQQGITKIEIAARMKTSRNESDRELDPKIPFVTLDTLKRAPSAVGRRLRFDLI